MKTFEYNYFNKLYFFISYILYRFLVLFETKRNKSRLFLIGVFYSLFNLILVISNYKLNLSKWFYKFCNLDYVETKFGKFHIRNNTIDAIVASPSFERNDVNYLINIVSNCISKNNNILFVDIGAEFGYYSVLLANKFNNHELLEIYCFEPTSQSRSFLEKNIEINGVKNITVSPLALYKTENIDLPIKIEAAATASNSISLITESEGNYEIVRTTTIDNMLSKIINNFDVIILKIDIEGFETEALMGATETLRSNKKIFLMVEDFVNRKIIDYLEDSNAVFVGKFNTYNSWWKING